MRDFVALNASPKQIAKLREKVKALEEAIAALQKT